MPNDSSHRLEAVFHAACTHPAGAPRQAFLDGACGDDAGLRARVEALLDAHEAASGFLEAPALERTPEGPGTSIGAYRLLQEIGEGGMGVVYMAEQERPVRRKVALKVIKLGMDTKQVIARFEAERQAIALMEHPHIARVLDAGATEAGRPYFVMELVRGIPINEYCDKHRLSTVERLKLFAQVCRAVQHAHLKGVIHRDLKPTNVLVTSHDGTPVPKIIDFGVAKATNQKLTERTLFTEFHQIIGTPEYMSPEQAELSGLDVDTRSDIYSLGVLLYQLLTGTTPVDSTVLRTAGFEEMTRMICEEEPPAPSTRVSKLGTDGEPMAAKRGSNPESLSKHFRGDLDWIVLKALEKDRTRRYETATALAEDVDRHLEQRPVVAGPPGVAYRVRKFARRNRKAVIAASALLLVLGLGLAGTTAGFLKARAEASRAGAMSNSLQDVLALTGTSSGTDQSEVESLLATVEDVFGTEHATYAAVLDTLSTRLYDAGDFQAAEDLSRQALSVWTGLLGEGHPNVGEALTRLGRSLRGSGDDANAETVLRKALHVFADSGQGDHPAGYAPRVELADLLANRGAYKEADELLGQALDLLRASPSPARYRILDTLERRALVQMSRPEFDARETVRAMYEEVHDFYREDSPIAAIVSLGYARQLIQHRDSQQAERYLREAIDRFEALAEPPRVHLLEARDALFQIIRRREDMPSILETDELLEALIESGRTYWGVENLTATLQHYASRMADRGRFTDALDASLESHQVWVDADRPTSDREGARDNLTGLAFLVALQPGLSRELYEHANRAVELALSEEPSHSAMRAARGMVQYRLGHYELARRLLALPSGSLSQYKGGLANHMAPADHAFRCMTLARLGEHALAAEELETLRAATRGRSSDSQGQTLLREVEALIETLLSSPEAGR